MDEKQEQTLELSSRKRRIAAFLIDHVVITFLLVLIDFSALGTGFIDEKNMDKMPAVMLAVIIPGLLLYFAKDSINGTSVGKWIMGIRVRKSNNPHEVPSFGSLFIRNIFIIIWPIEFIVLALSEEKKRLGDKVAETIVVKNPSKQSKTIKIVALVGIGIVFFAFMFLFTANVMKNSGAYKVAIHEIENNQEILKETGGIIGYGMMPAGNINISNGKGQAQLNIKVVGKDKNMRISVFLIKEPDGKWELIEMRK